MTHFTIDELTIPASLADANAADFIASVAVQNTIETEILGTDALAYSAAEILPFYQNQEFDPKRCFVAKVDGRVVGRGVLEWPIEPGDGERIAWLTVEVLADFRRRGIGTALIGHVEHLARADGRTTWQAWAAHTNVKGGERLPSPTGFGSVPLADPGVRFLQARGYKLEQVERISFLQLPVDPEELVRHRAEADAAAGPDYRVLSWRGPTPDVWVNDLVNLRTRMSTDMPAAGLDIVEAAWTPDRIAKYDASQVEGGREALTVAAEHIPTGRLAAFSQLTIPSNRSRPASQEDTLVLAEHRGHRLGMLLKIANIQHLTEVNPQSPLITTYNAEENRYMLNVNEAVGFRAVGYEGAWQKDASGEASLDASGA